MAATERALALKAKLGEAVQVSKALKVRLARVEQKLAEAKLRLGEFDFGEDGFEWRDVDESSRASKTRSDGRSRTSRPVETTVVQPLEIHHDAAVELDGDLIETTEKKSRRAYIDLGDSNDREWLEPSPVVFIPAKMRRE